MPEPTTTAVSILAGAGVVLFGVSTGLHPVLLVAALAGGLWAQFYRFQTPALQRIASIALGTLISAWAAPPVAWGIVGAIGARYEGPLDLLAILVAIAGGLLFHAGGAIVLRKAEAFGK